MQERVVAVKVELMKRLHLPASIGFDIGICKTLPDIADSQRTRMKHIIGVETIVAQFIEHNLIRREISSVAVEQLVNSQQQSGFGELVLVQTVLDMPNRRDGEYKLLVGIGGKDWLPYTDDVLYRQATTGKLRGRQFMAVGNHHTIALIDPCGAESDNHHRSLSPSLLHTPDTLLHRMAGLLPVGRRERTVVVHRMKQPAPLHQLRHTRQCQRISDRNRVVERPERVGGDLEIGRCEADICTGVENCIVIAGLTDYYSKCITLAGLIFVTIAEGANRISNDTAIVPMLSSNHHPHGKAIGT